jgi:hypothetical protein
MQCSQCLYWRQPHTDKAVAEFCFSWRWRERGGGVQGPNAKAPPPDLRGKSQACQYFEGATRP